MHERIDQPNPSRAASRATPAGSAVAPLAIRSAPFKGWEAVWIERGPLTLILVPQVGGRIMSVRWRGRELAFVDPAYQGRVDDIAAIADLHGYKRRSGFLLWGGEKTWLAPQDRWTDGAPFVDLARPDHRGRYRKSVPTYSNRPYGNGCVLEVFNAPGLPYLELELHGPLASLQPGESFSIPTDAALFDLDVVPSTAAAAREGLALA